MKKRLRKKKHIGEFAEWGRELTVQRNTKEGFDDFFFAFIDEAIEANGLTCGGGGSEDSLSVIIELGARNDPQDERIEQVKKWLDDRQDVQDYKVGELVDVWYGEF